VGQRASQRTLYRAFGSKAGLFRAVMEAVLAGGGARAETPVEQRAAIKAIIAEPDARRQIERYAATQPGIHRRAGPLLRALSAAAASDPELNDLWREMEAWRFSGQSRFVGMLADQGKLRSGLPIERACDIVWTLCSLAVCDLLVLERRWSDQHYQGWLADSLERELLPELNAASRRRPRPD